MHSNAYTFGFAAAVTIVCSFLLSLAYTALKPMQDINVDAYVKNNILSVAGVTVKEGDNIAKLFADNMELKFVNVEGDFIDVDPAVSSKFNFVKEWKSFNIPRNVDKKITDLTPYKKMRLPLYISKDSNGNAKYYIIPLHGMGLWSLLEGYLALESDLNTVAGITFYEQKETAGLGAEIQQPWFPANFPGKKIYDEQGNLVGIKVKKGKLSSDPTEEEKTHYVDGISGATITGDGVTTLLLKDLSLYEPTFKKLLAAKEATVSVDSETVSESSETN